MADWKAADLLGNGRNGDPLPLHFSSQKVQRQACLSPTVGLCGSPIQSSEVAETNPIGSCVNISEMSDIQAHHHEYVEGSNHSEVPK